jgi:hypothetical protein
MLKTMKSENCFHLESNFRITNRQAGTVHVRVIAGLDDEEQGGKKGDNRTETNSTLRQEENEQQVKERQRFSPVEETMRISHSNRSTPKRTNNPKENSPQQYDPLTPVRTSSRSLSKLGSPQSKLPSLLAGRLQRHHSIPVPKAHSINLSAEGKLYPVEPE